MLDLDDFYKTDLDAEENGRWFKTRFGGIPIKVARVRNRNYRRILAKMTEVDRGKFTENPDSEESRTILLKAMAEAILVDWKAKDKETGKIDKYTPEKGFAALRDYPDFREEVSELATNMENYRIRVIEEAEKN